MTNFNLTTDALQHAETIDEPVRVSAQLRKLSTGLSADVFREAIRGGLAARNEVTLASAPTAAGIQQWLKTVEDLRTLLAAQQWHVHSQQNCPFISSPDRSVTIVVMTGSGETGRCDGDDPTNQANKGTVTRNFTAQNYQQLELFNRESFKFIKKSLREQQEGTQVWVLLYHYDTVNRPGNRGGCFVIVNQPICQYWRVDCSSFPLPRQAGYSRWPNAVADG